jgi:CubicO group peptidase (beta-lactamase class C family)
LQTIDGFVRRIALPAFAVICTFGFGPAVLGQSAPRDIESQLAAIEKTIDAKRQELHVPGAALVIVKDDKIVYVKGMGLRDVASKLPVTPNTQFAIGSSTKAFTAMTVMMSVDDGKISLADSPRKFLPYFKMRDPEADQKITIADLLCHRSGLNRTDMAWYTNKLNAEETIRLVSQIKPTEKFGAKFQYQNVMFLVAGQCVGAAQKAPWRTVVSNRILKPLGMKTTNTSVRDLARSKDHALGYSYDAEKKEHVLLPYHDLPAIAPAGAINSNAPEMAQWLRLMLGRGVFEGKRLVSEASFDELYKKRINVAGPVDYGFGWFLRDWNGHKVVEHGGNIDGFNAQVALMPDQNLGFVLLTNISASPLGSIAMNAVWENLVGAPKPAAEAAVASTEKVAPELEAGTYRLQGANIDVVIEAKNGKLTARAPGVPESTLENVSGRRYKVVIPGLDGVFATFRPAKDDPKETEMFFEQPGAKLVGKRVPGSEDAAYSGPLKELVGKYRSSKVPVTFEVSVRSGKVALIVPGQPAYPLNPKPAKDEYSLGGLPDTFSFSIHRDATGKVSGALLRQPPAQGDLELACESTAFVPPMPVEELMKKVVEAQGGEAKLRRHQSLVVKTTSTIETQGLTVNAVEYSRSPNISANVQKMYAGKKLIGTIRSYFDGKEGGNEPSFGVTVKASGETLNDVTIASSVYPELNWKTLFTSVAISGKDKVGEEEVLVVEMTPEKGHPVTDYISTKTYRVLRRKAYPGPVVESYDDFRNIDGVLIPYRRTGVAPGLGDAVTMVTSVQFDAKMPDALFHAKNPPAREASQ